LYRNLASENYLNKEAVFVVSYFFIYILLIAIFPGLESANWISLVFLPLLLIYVHQKKNSTQNSFILSLASFGIKKYNLGRGILLSLFLGIISAFLIMLFAITNGKIYFHEINPGLLLYLPIALLFILLTTAILEEFFFRAILQSRIERLLKRKYAAIFISSVLFGLYYLAFYYVNQNLVQYNYTHISLITAYGHGMFVGLISGYLYTKTEENLIASILYNSLCSSIVTTVYFQQYFF